eukprot:COSAG06_NODE_64679_length_259_cov_0.512500_1_plen_54_part_10
MNDGSIIARALHTTGSETAGRTHFWGLIPSSDGGGTGAFSVVAIVRWCWWSVQ